MASSSSDSWTVSIDPERLLSYKFPQTTFTYTERDVAIYALGIGACARDALDEKELKYLYHKDGQTFIQALPTFPAIFTSGIALSLHKLPGMQYVLLPAKVGYCSSVRQTVVVDHSSYHLFRPIDRDAYEVIVENGKLVYRHSGIFINTVEGSKWIFVLSTSRLLYVGQKKKGLFQHSSFLAGGATTAAGRFVAHDGVLEGCLYYKPRKQWG